MNNKGKKALCMELIKADTEEEVIALLKDEGFWENEPLWRNYGGIELNWSQVGNQMSSAAAAVVEKITNSIDARLINECLIRGIDPEGQNAPKTIREAVASFFENSFDNPNKGIIKNWLPEKRTEVSKGITLTSTGLKPSEGYPSITISDCGEGQTPDRMSDTLLSLSKENKQRIPFVHGKFNMGGTGALVFCGYHNLQLILTKKNPKLINSSNNRDHEWGFTIVRREAPTGNKRSSVYTYLAPLEVNNGRDGSVLSFMAEKMPIFPEKNKPYIRDSEWGTLIKLYEYGMTGSKSNMLMKDGLMRKLDLLLAEVALPFRLHECRFHGHKGSYDTTVSGLTTRLEDERQTNIEEDFPAPLLMSIDGEQLRGSIYAFKRNKDATYKKNEGIVFTINGQSHGHLPKDFFRRKRVNLDYLVDSLLVVIDCTDMSARATEDLFKNSRDRLSENELKLSIENELEEVLGEHTGLRELANRRREEMMEEKLDEDKPLENILEDILKKSPSLNSLFIKGERVSTPFKTKKVKDTERKFVGKRFPTYFKFLDQEYGAKLKKDCHINLRARVFFETDAVNDYFIRNIDRGQYSISIINNGVREEVKKCTFNPFNGIATLNITLPEWVKVGDELHLVVTVNDRTRVEPFVNELIVKVKKEADIINGNSGKRRKSPSNKSGKKREVSTALALPDIKKVKEEEWDTYGFNKFSALDVTRNSENTYDYYINVDNLYLKNELKNKKDKQEITNARFIYGMFLLGLSVINYYEKEKIDQEENNDGETVSLREQVKKLSEAFAPIVIPMIESLGSLDFEEKIISGARV